MKLIIKTFVFLIALIIINATNLKLYRNLDAKNTYFSDFEEDRSKLLINKFFSIPKSSNNSNFEILDLFQDIGDKTFICVILLYFNSSASYLFFSTLIMKIVFLNTKHFLYESFFTEFFLFKVLFPIKIFQFIGVLFYQICGYSILFKMIFNNNETSFKKIETEDLKECFILQEKIKLLFIILFSFFSSFNIENLNERQMISMTFNNFINNFSSVFISILIAFLIAHAIFKKFSKEFTMIITSITFLLLSIDGAVKVFAY